MHRTMEMHQIRYFLAVARTLNFTEAAAHCEVSQPALSRGIKQLEAELGGDLFRRERSLTHLTELGRAMLPLLAQSYESALSAQSLATSLQEGKFAPLRLALSYTVDLRCLLAPLSELMDALPGVELKFFRGDGPALADALKSGEFELAVAGPLCSDWERFRAWPLFNSEFRLALHRDHALAGKDKVSFSQLIGERMISRPYCELAEEMSGLLSDAGISVLTSDAVTTDHDVLALLSANIGLALMPSITPCGDDLRLIPVDGLEKITTVHLYCVTGRRYSPAAEAMVRLLRSTNWKRVLARRDVCAA